MRPSVAALVLALAALLEPMAVAGSGTSGLPLPRGSRRVDDGHYISRQTFRKTVVFYRKHFTARGIKHEEIPTYGYRGVIVSRFLARGPSPWLAVHVFKIKGTTHIVIVPAAETKPPPKPPDKPLDPARPSG